MARLARITALRWVKPQMATSMQPRTGTPTKTLGAVGRAQVRTRIRSTTHLPVGGANRTRAADRRPSTAEAEVGNPGRQVPVAQQAGAVAVAGEAAGEHKG